MAAVYGMLSTTPLSKAETKRINIVAVSGSPPVARAAASAIWADASLNERADHDEKSREEEQRFPFHAGHEVARLTARQQH